MERILQSLQDIENANISDFKLKLSKNEIKSLRQRAFVIKDKTPIIEPTKPENETIKDEKNIEKKAEKSSFLDRPRKYTSRPPQPLNLDDLMTNREDIKFKTNNFKMINPLYRRIKTSKYKRRMNSGSFFQQPNQKVEINQTLKVSQILLNYLIQSHNKSLNVSPKNYNLELIHRDSMKM